MISIDETIVVTENTMRLEGFSPRAAFLYVKGHNGKLFLRNKELKVEEMIVYIGGNLIEVRIKHNHKVVSDVEALPFKVVEVLDTFNEAIGLWCS